VTAAEELAALRERLRATVARWREWVRVTRGAPFSSDDICDNTEELAEEIEALLQLPTEKFRALGNAPQAPWSLPEGPRREAMEALSSHTAGCRCFYCAAMQKLLVMMDHPKEPKP
jgi:hypothetical protein